MPDVVGPPPSALPFVDESAATIRRIRRHRLVTTVRRTFRADCGVAAGARVVVGVSGGADSLALLLACAVMRRETEAGGPRLRPVAVHVHHHLRDDADLDEAHVRRLCRALAVPFVAAHVHPKGDAGSRAGAARQRRYEALLRVAREVGAEAVAVAHHADDQLETVLMALGRGAGPRGLAGMRSRRALAPDVVLVRPLLRTRHVECEQCCREAGVEWREDPTNEDRTAARTRIRHEVVPVLESLWPRVATHAASASAAIGALADGLDRRTRRALGSAAARTWSRHTLRTSDPLIVSTGLRDAAIARAPSCADRLTRVMLDEVVAAIRATDTRTRTFDWPEGLRLSLGADVVRLKRVMEVPTS